MNKEEHVGREVAALETIQSKIYEIRCVKVMLDFDLAKLYGVETRVLKQAVRRNITRFDDDFMFILNNDECNSLIYIGVSQNVIPKGYNTGGSNIMAFTELGVAMLSSVLRSEIAININKNIMRAFVAMRQMLYNADNVNKEIMEIKNRMLMLERGNDETLQAVNDLSEDMRNELDDIYLALGELAKKAKQAENNKDEPRNPIGFKRSLS